MRRRTIITAFGLLSALGAVAWRLVVVQNHSPEVSSVELLAKKQLGTSGIAQVTAVNIGPHRITILLAILNPNDCKLEIEDSPNHGTARAHLADLCSSKDVIAGVNGGYFKADFSPAGLWIEKGILRSALSNQSPLSCVIGVDREGRIRIQTREQPIGELVSAIQAGPFLIDPGGLPGISSGAAVRSRRSALAIATDGRVFVVSTSEASLYELAAVLRQIDRLLPGAQIERAANLDGGPSCAFWVNDPAIEPVKEVGPVRNYLLFTPVTKR